MFSEKVDQADLDIKDPFIGGGLGAFMHSEIRKTKRPW